MPQVIVTSGALAGMERCRRFLLTAGTDTSVRARETIAHHLALLTQTPQMGHPLAEGDFLRELLIPFGNSGYIALYRFNPDEGITYVLAFRHQREAGY